MTVCDLKELSSATDLIIWSLGGALGVKYLITPISIHTAGMLMAGM